MATSLADQLQRLKVPETSVLIRDNKRPSLLFNPKEAATLSKETVYQIGLEGLEELIQKNEVFSQFKHTLFHETSKSFERSVQTAEINEKLNKSLRRMLLSMSPYFLFNCSHKVLEWLICRFSIHEYLRDDLLMSCLPYHESTMFVRVLQLLKFKDKNDSFYFLKSFQKSGTHLPKQSLLNHAASDIGFLKYVTLYLKDLLKVHSKHELLSVAINFYCTVFTGTLEYLDNIGEDILCQMLPLIIKGLNSTTADFYAASLVVTVRLVTKTTLSDHLIDKLVEKISEFSVSNLKKEASLVLIIIYQSQEHYKHIPSTAVNNILNIQELPKILNNLQSNGNSIYPFLKRLISCFTHEGVNNDEKLSRDVMKACLDLIKVKNTFVFTILRCILDAVNTKLQISPEAQNWLTEIIHSIEQQYPTPFDKAVHKILSTSSDKRSVKRRKCLSKIIKNSVIYRGKFELFEKLYHPNPAIRGEAIKLLCNNFDDLKDTDRQLVNKSLVDKLNDNDVMVVKNTLEILKKCDAVDKCGIKSALINLANKYQKDKSGWGLISDNVVNLLTSLYEPNDWEVFISLFSFLLPQTSKNMSRAKKILETPFIVKNNLFKSDLQKLKNAEEEESFITLLLNTLSKNNDVEIVKSLIDVVKKNETVNYSFHKYILILLLSTILPQDSNLEIAGQVLNIFSTLYYSSSKKFEKKASVIGYIQKAIAGKFPVQGFLQCLEKFIYKIKKPDIDLKQRDFSINNHENDYYINITCLLLDKEEYLKKFLKANFQNFNEEMEFFLNVSVSGNSHLYTNFKSKILKYIESILKQNLETEDTITINNYLIVLLLALMADSEENLRKTVIHILTMLTTMSTQKENRYNPLINSLIKHKEEIIIDNQQIPSIIFNTLDPSNTKGKRNSKDLNFIRNDLFSLSCRNDTPAYLKATILWAFSLIDTFESLEETTDMALNILKNNSIELTSFNAKIIKLVVSKINSQVIGRLNMDSKTWRLLETFINSDKTIIKDSEDTLSLSSLTLNQLNSDTFSSLEDEVVVKSILKIIIELSLTTQDSEVVFIISRIFKHIDLNAEWIKEHLVSMRDVQSSKIDENKKKRRIGIVPTVDILDTFEWKKGVAVLEFIQDKKKIRNIECVLPIFFDLLKRCLDFDEQSAVEYPKQLLLAIIHQSCMKLDGVLPENLFNVELIVQCIRASQNPQTHHQALLVLAYTANLLPTQVLHHMMAIFTFMGSSVLRHEDAYSFQLISKIIDTVIPIITKGDGEDIQVHNVTKILRIFVDVILDVPEHRRIPLYKQLLETINVKEHLYIFLLLLFESQIKSGTIQKKEKDAVQRKLDIGADICKEFSPSIVIYNCIRLLQHLSNLPDEKQDNIEVDDETTPNLSSFSPKDFRHYKYLIVKFTANLLGSHSFVKQVADLNEEEELNLEPLFKEIIISVLQYIQRVSKIVEKFSNTPQVQYWKVLLHLNYDILDSVNALVTPQMFLLITKGLLVHKLPTVKKRILELLINKLQYNKEFFYHEEKTDLYSLIHPITSIIEGGKEEEGDTEQETVIQTSLLCLKLLVKTLAPEEPEKFVPILDFVTGLLMSKKTQSNIQASVVLCLAELCVTLKGFAIGSLPDFMPALIKILKRQKHCETHNMLIRSLITTIEKILDSMPLFLSPYLEKLLTEITQLISTCTNNEEHKTQAFSTKLSSVKQKIGHSIPLRMLLPTVQSSYDVLLENKCFKAITVLLDILAETISNTTTSDLNSNLNQLTNLFFSILKFRTENLCSAEDIEDVETHIINAFTVLILKLSENTFRPLYYKLYDWAVRSEIKDERLITFYSLSSRIAESLKSLFVLFASHFINNSAQILDGCNLSKTEDLYFTDEEKNVILIENILKTLNSVFLYDNQKFINRDRFNILMQPLVDQLENTLGGLDVLTKRNTELVTPCLVHFSVAVADDALWKQINYQILLKMRNNTAKIRLIALHCLTEIVKKLGEDFLPLLPETIPFLAELLEDEEEDIEKNCQKAVREMEAVLGESLQKYF
ncbi:HEAT repeat-containing protein 1 homolog [Diorhabda sublineata]|uniref:HEAT repeat-containing protein 1 homolog n=1 Tax=Diorhabda sublineata TaxID=1163346 RepID=UPI0024E0A751|nr:HEAT repeat-containing protein 1 homolog [Diorhabda sublineata]